MIKLLKKCWIPFALLLIIVAVILSLLRTLTPWAVQYKAEVEEHLSALIGERVTIKTLETGWYWFEPVIKLGQVTVASDKKDLIKINKLAIGIDLLSSLWHWRFQPGILYLDGLNLTLHQKDEHWEVDGISSADSDAETYKLALAWVLAQQKIIINHLSIPIYLSDGTTIPLNDLQVVIASRLGHYQIKGWVQLAQAVPTIFEWTADLKFNQDTLNQASGRAFISIEKAVFNQWRRFIPQTRWALLDGEGDIQLWLSFFNGSVKNIQSSIKSSKLVVKDSSTQESYSIPSLSANLAWHLTPDGWQLSGDHLRLNWRNFQWPENKFKVRYERAQQDYFVFVKTILLQPLLTNTITWPERFNQLLAIKPHGELYDTQIHFKTNAIEEFLVRFSNLGWLATDKRPGVDNLSGVLHWKPTDGRLELGSEKTVLTLKNQPPVTFSVFNTALNWKATQTGFQIALQRLVLVHPNLLLNASGRIEDVKEDTAGQMHIKAKLAATDAQRWLTYLPKAYLKPKLNTWLKHDIKRIDKINAEAIVEGRADDFPFDKHPGTFLIKSHLSGVDLIFAPGWPLTREIEGFLTVDKRVLDANVVHASLKKVILEKANVRVKDLGLNQEMLLVRGKVETPTDKALAYVLSSPLRKKLAALSQLQFQGDLGLDLQLEISLHPGSDAVWVLGDIALKNNQLTLHHSLGNLVFDNLNGSLQLDQEGVLDGHLNTSLKGHPVAVSVQSLLQPKPYTEIKMTGHTTIGELYKAYPSPAWSVMKGPLNLEVALLLPTDPNALNHLQIRSSLKEISVSLPSPLGKPAVTTAPCTIDVAFDSKKMVGLHFNYGKRLNGDLWFSDTSDALAVQKGVVRIGKERAPWQEQEGLAIVGELASFDLAQWLAVKEKFSGSSEKNTLFEQINSLDLKLHKAVIKGKNIDELAIGATKLDKGDWLVRLNQENLIANVRYNPTTNTVTGIIDKLIIKKSNEPANTSESTLKVADMPNLDLHITSLQWNEINVGDAILQATRTPTNWRIDSFKVNTLPYQLAAKGEWKQDDKVNATTIETVLHINDLAKSLTRWKVSPVVAAYKGDLHFEGGWAGAIQDFSIAKIAGKMSIRFKNGLITHLSSEAQEKLAFGKLLSILSLQTIPRRLKLDFSDLSEGGYSFDDFNGDFIVEHGAMRTQNSSIDGPVASATMKGQIDLVKRFYDLELQISPHITASLPVIAFAAGPVVGIAALVANTVITKSVQKISGYTYRITGPWSNPDVRQVSIIEKRS